MRKSLIIVMLLLLIISLSYSQQTLDKFLNMPWESDKATVKQEMLKRDGVTFIESSSNDTKLFFRGGTFAGTAVTMWGFFFLDDKFYSVRVIQVPTQEVYILQNYLSIIENYKRKYGDPAKQSFQFKYPYEYGDGHEVTAIKTGKSVIYSIWFFGADRETANSIAIDITDTPSIRIDYTCERLYKIYRERKNEEVDDEI